MVHRAAVRGLLAVAAVCLGCRGPEPLASPSAAQASTPSAIQASPPPASARPVVVRDGDEYSFSIPPSASPCIEFPAAQFDPVACPPEARPVDPPPVPERMRVLTIGLLRLQDHGVQRRAQFMASLKRMLHPFQPNQRVAEAFARGVVDGALETFRGAPVRGAVPTVLLLSINGLTTARISFDLDGVTGPYESSQHWVCHVVWGDPMAYVFAIMTSSAAAAASDRLADELAQTIRLQHPAPPLIPR